MEYLRDPLVAQMVKNLPAMQENQVRSIPGSEICPGEGNGYPLQYFRMENWRATVHEVTKSWTQLTNTFNTLFVQNDQTGFKVLDSWPALHITEILKVCLYHIL